MGIGGAERGRWERTLMKRTMSGSHGLVRERMVRHQSDNVAALADHDLGIKGELACQFRAELRAGDWTPDHEGARRADVDDIEMRQLFGERTRTEGPVTADVHPSQKHHECHGCLLLASREN